MKKIEKMHSIFGCFDGQKCKGCNHFTRYGYHNRTLSKCLIYGDTRSSASDWSGRYTACGLFNKDYYSERSIMEMSFGRKKPIEIEGQIGLDFGGNNDD